MGPVSGTFRAPHRVSGCAGRGRWAWPAARSPSGCCGPPWTGPRRWVAPARTGAGFPPSWTGAATAARRCSPRST